jgi:hypothetical protein
MNELLLLHSGDIRNSFHLHDHNVGTAKYDIIISLMESGQVMYTAVHRTEMSIISQSNVSYASKLDKLLEIYSPGTFSRSIRIQKIFGIYRNVSWGYDISTMFFILVNKYTNKKTLMQVNVTNHDTAKAEYSFVENWYGRTSIPMDIMVKENSVYSDTNSERTIQTFIMFVDIEQSRTQTVADAYVKGMRLLVLPNEKSEFLSIHPEIELPQTDYPIANMVDAPPIFMRMPTDASEVDFNFSTGMGFVKFTE